MGAEAPHRRPAAVLPEVRGLKFLPLCPHLRWAPGGVQDALVADFDGNGRSDVALVHDQQLRVRLSSAGPLDNLRFVANLGTGVSEVAQGDFNEDSKIDLVVGRWDGIQIFTGLAVVGLLPGPWSQVTPREPWGWPT